MSVPVSETGKHFTDDNRTLATGIVTAAASIGYFIAPLFTQYSLGEHGWQETLPLMRVGEKWQLVIPPHHAYGKRGKGAIRPNETLLFDVELLAIQ